MAKRQTLNDRKNKPVNPLFAPQPLEEDKSAEKVEAKKPAKKTETPPEETTQETIEAPANKEEKAKPTRKAKATVKVEEPKKSNAGRKPGSKTNLKVKKKSLKKDELSALEDNLTRKTYLISDSLYDALKIYAAMERVDISQTVRGALIDAIPDEYLRMGIERNK